ncbi:MAG: hypothetical protein WCA27_21455 [Candidatus Sulfotelmatobacter sp.]
MLLVTRAPDQPQDDTRPNLLYAVATFDHELLPKGTHDWIVRRFNAFTVAYNSGLAILISVIIVGLRGCHHWSFQGVCGMSEMQWQQQARWAWFGSKFWWLAVNILLMALLFCAAFRSWKETMGMIEFQARRKNVYELERRK